MRHIARNTALAAIYLSTTFLVMPAQAQAEDFFSEDIRPYIGAEYQFLDADMGTNTETIGGTTFTYSYDDVYESSYQAIAPFAGLRFGDYAGVELSYTHSMEESKNVSGTNITSNTTFTLWSLDWMGYLPINEDKSFELIGSLGMGIIEAEATGTAIVNSIPVSASASESGAAGRIGLGAQYNLTDTIGIRTMARYMRTNLDVADSATSYSIGITYRF